MNVDNGELEFKEATLSNITDLISVEKKLTNLKIYSAMIDEKEWQEDINKENTKVYLIIKDGKVIGNVSYEIDNNKTARIIGLAVDPEFQKQGVGKKTIEFILEVLKDMNTIELATHPKNPALKLYLSLGFTIQSEKVNYFGDGEPRLILIKSQK